MERKKILTSLISLRFFFALRVYASHLKPLMGDSSVYNWLYENVLYVPFGVSFFYTLSGFVLAYSYKDKFISKSMLLGDFYINRFVRIYPLHIITLLIILPVSEEFYYFENILGWFTRLFSSISLMQSFVPIRSVYFSYNSPSWSLSNALWFYAIFPLVVVWINKLKIKRVFYILVLVLTVLPFFMIYTPKEYQHWLFYINPLFRSIDFILGILLFEIYDKVRQININKLYYSFLEIGSLVVFVVYIALCEYIPEVVRDSYGNWFPISLIIISFSFERGVVSKIILKNKYLISLGGVSFGIFIFHNIVLKYFTLLNDYLKIEEPIVIFATTLFVTIGVSFISEKYLERNIGRYLKKNIGSIVNIYYMRMQKTDWIN